MNAQMNRSDWMAHAEAAAKAAARWAAVAEQHEHFARRDCWSASNMTAMSARDNEARCKAAAANARSMACDVR